MAHLRSRATPAAESLDQIWEKRGYDVYPVDIAKPNSIRAGSVLAGHSARSDPQYIHRARARRYEDENAWGPFLDKCCSTWTSVA